MIRTLLAGAALCLSTTVGQAQQRPPFPPQSPFTAEARFANGMMGTIRYQDGKARVEAQSPSGPVTAWLDFATRSAVIALSMQGMNMGLDLDLDEFGVPDISDVAAERIGDDRVLGEPCGLWQMREPKSGRPAVACVTADGIPLRVTGDSPQDGMEVTRLERGSQDGAALLPPPDLSTMKATGLQNLPFDLPIPGLGR